jgi:hypothetical protein
VALKRHSNDASPRGSWITAASTLSSIEPDEGGHQSQSMGFVTAAWALFPSSR